MSTRSSIGSAGEQPALPALLTVPEVAEWARVSPKTVYRWIKDHKLAALQLGPRTYRIEPDAVRQFLEASGYGDLSWPETARLGEAR